MKTITVKVKSGIWKRAGEESVVRRIALVVCGHDTEVQQKPTGYKWNLFGNDWLAGPLEGGEIEIVYRYGTPEVMKALEIFLNWIFD